MNVSTIKSGFAFARNPVVISENFTNAAVDKFGGTFYVRMDGMNLFTGCFFPPLKVDLSEILDANAPYFQDADDVTESLRCIEDGGDMVFREVSVEADCGSQRTSYSFTCIPGGISNQNFKRLVKAGQDAFTSRFCNYRGNFFMTTRTTGYKIVIKETELYPLYFLLNRSSTIVLKSVETLSEVGFPENWSGVYAMNLASIRRQFFDEHNELPSVLDVYVDQEYACRIVIEASDTRKERYRMKFRNSLGVFEIIELTGEMSIAPEYSSAEDATYQLPDSVTGALVTKRDRMERRQTVTVDTGFKRPEEVRFFMDMLSSEEVYLLDLIGEPVRVIPTVEDMSYSPRPEEPASYSLNLEISEPEFNIMEEILTGDESRKPRIFTKQFTKQFN